MLKLLFMSWQFSGILRSRLREMANENSVISMMLYSQSMMDLKEVTLSETKRKIGSQEALIGT